MQGLGCPKYYVDLLVGGVGLQAAWLQFSWGWCPLDGGQGWSPATPRAGAGLLVCGLCLQAMGLQFPGAGCSPLVDETCPEARAGSLVGKAGDSGAGSAHCLWSCIPRSLVVGPWGGLRSSAYAVVCGA